jgi:hypothetical protein
MHFQAGEKCRLDNAADTIDRRVSYVNEDLPQLHADLTALQQNGDDLDCFFHYLYGQWELHAECRRMRAGKGW